MNKLQETKETSQFKNQMRDEDISYVCVVYVCIRCILVVCGKMEPFQNCLNREKKKRSARLLHTRKKMLRFEATRFSSAHTFQKYSSEFS